MDPNVMDPGTAAAAGGLALIPLLISLAFSLFMIIAMWKVFAKAGQPGWGVIVPIYNIICMLNIAGKPIWWIILCFVPFVNIVVIILIYAAMAKAFGKGAGFVVGMILLPIIFWPILGFGSSEYQGAVEAAPAA
jgi:hypothetical protein